VEQHLAFAGDRPAEQQARVAQRDGEGEAGQPAAEADALARVAREGVLLLLGRLDHRVGGGALAEVDLGAVDRQLAGVDHGRRAIRRRLVGQGDRRAVTMGVLEVDGAPTAGRQPVGIELAWADQH
jgi:hypothetical protein